MAEPPESPFAADVTSVVEVDPVAARRRGVFTVMSGLDAGRVLTIPPGDIVTLGRSAECTFPFDDASLSRDHARVMRVGSEYVLRDDGSRNGTFVNSQRLAKATTLRDGDRVQLGSNTMLRFTLVDEKEEAALRKVYEAAILDGLTGVYNRKHLEERIAAELAFAERHATPLSVVIIDVDHFKKVNDTYGHLAGDAVLKSVAALLAKSVRPEDVLARYGGEEFVVVARGTTCAQAAELAERLRSAIESTTITFEATAIRVTASSGVAAVGDGGASHDRASLLGAADARLYRAKTSGRNRVVASDG